MCVCMFFKIKKPQRYIISYNKSLFSVTDWSLNVNKTIEERIVIQIDAEALLILRLAGFCSQPYFLKKRIFVSLDDCFYINNELLIDY